MEELDIMEILYAFKKKFKYIILTVIIFALLGFAYSEILVVPMYKSTISFVLSKSVDNNVEDKNNGEAITTNDITLNSKLVATYSKIIKSRTIAKQVIDSLGIDMKVEKFISNISVTSQDDTELIEITVSNEDPKLSADIANSLAEVFREKVNEVYGINNLSVIDVPEVADLPYNIGTMKNVVLFAIIGLAISCGIVFIIVYFDNTVKDEKDIEDLLNIPVIVSIPKAEEYSERRK